MMLYSSCCCCGCHSCLVVLMLWLLPMLFLCDMHCYSLSSLFYFLFFFFLLFIVVLYTFHIVVLLPQFLLLILLIPSHIPLFSPNRFLVIAYFHFHFLNTLACWTIVTCTIARFCRCAFPPTVLHCKSILSASFIQARTLEWLVPSLVQRYMLANHHCHYKVLLKSNYRLTVALSVASSQQNC